MVDASVAAKWYLEDERYVQQELALRDAHRQGNVDIAASDHLRYETANAIRNAVRAGRLTQERGEAVIAGLLELPIEFAGAPQLLRGAFDRCLRLNCSLYDALYLTLAEIIDAFLVSDD